MESKVSTKNVRARSASVTTQSLRVRRETKRRLLAELAKVNKKDFGKKVRPDALICLALSLLNDAHIKALQESSMTNSDRLELRYRDYCKKHGATSKDEFLGKVLTGNEALNDAETVTNDSAQGTGEMYVKR